MYVDVGMPTYEESADTSICKEHKIVELGGMAWLD